MIKNCNLYSLHFRPLFRHFFGQHRHRDRWEPKKRLTRGDVREVTEKVHSRHAKLTPLEPQKHGFRLGGDDILHVLGSWKMAPFWIHFGLHFRTILEPLGLTSAPGEAQEAHFRRKNGYTKNHQKIGLGVQSPGWP